MNPVRRPSTGAGPSAKHLLYVRQVAPYCDDNGALTAAGAHGSLDAAGTALQEVASLCSLTYREVRHVCELDEDGLVEARVLVLFTIGETPWSPQQRRLIPELVRAGSLGLVGLHSATDSAHRWANFGRMIGARFAGHPVTGEISLNVLDRRHPATAHLPDPWRVRDELYLFRQMSKDLKPLLGIALPGPGTGPGRSVLPAAWTIDRAKQRVFYTMLGHFLESYEDPAYLRHIWGGVAWAARLEERRPA